MLTIRPITPADDPLVGEILTACYEFIAPADGFTDEQLKRLREECCRPEHVAAMRLRYECYVAAMERTVIGMIAFQGHTLEELWVHPHYHRQGIGKTLFQYVEQLIYGAGHNHMTVATTGYGVPFYQAMGMRVTTRSSVTYGPLQGRDLIVLAKDLDQR